MCRGLWSPRASGRGDPVEEGDLVEQREGDVEHPLQRGLADALGRLVVALRPVGEVRAREAGGLQGVGVGSAAGEDPPRLVAARAQRGLRGEDLRRRGAEAMAFAAAAIALRPSSGRIPACAAWPWKCASRRKYVADAATTSPIGLAWSKTYPNCERSCETSNALAPASAFSSLTVKRSSTPSGALSTAAR